MHEWIVHNEIYDMHFAKQMGWNVIYCLFYKAWIFKVVDDKTKYLE